MTKERDMLSVKIGDTVFINIRQAKFLCVVAFFGGVPCGLAISILLGFLK